MTDRNETRLGAKMDVMSNDLLAALLRQTLLLTVPYSPVLHDLSLSPRNMKADRISIATPYMSQL